MPITRPGELLAGLDLTDLTHPRLRTSGMDGLAGTGSEDDEEVRVDGKEDPVVTTRAIH